MKKLLIISLILAAVFLFGCTGEPAYSGDTNSAAPANSNLSASNNQTTVATLQLFLAEIKSWDADAAPDGIEVTLEPKDRADNLVKAEGVVNATAYSRTTDSSYNYVKDQIVAQWQNVPVTKDSYGFMGSKVRLEFDPNFTIEKNDALWLDINFVTGGQTFSAEEDGVYNFG
ncbi:MAG: hypothetical protein V1847_04560 [Candidatus Diapherotrites archaeon]